MAVNVNITPLAETDGILYSASVPFTSTEADLSGGSGANSPDPIPTSFGEAIVAVVQFTNNGLITTNNAYVVMQMDMGDGVWVDMNWALWTNPLSATGVFVLSNGIAGANTFQNSRIAGVPPTTSGANQLALGGRIRFVGKATFAGGSSSAPGVTTQVTATIRYRILGLR